MTSAAGLASGGLHPVVAIYATFLNRAFDQVLLDVALHRLPVTFVLDRAGITGEDGPSHNGMWDLAILGVVPGLRIAAPRDEATLRAQLREAAAWHDGPTVLRFPKTPLGRDLPALRGIGGVDVLAEPDAGAVDVLVVAVGATGAEVVDAAEAVRQAGYTVRVVDPRWVPPVDPALVELAARRAAGRHRRGRCRLRRRRLAGRPDIARCGGRRPDPRDRRPGEVPRPRQGGRCARLRRG